MSENEPGLTEKAKGLAKEAAGAALGDEEMKAEGRSLREGTARGSKEYFREVIEESNKRAAGLAVGKGGWTTPRHTYPVLALLGGWILFRLLRRHPALLLLGAVLLDRRTRRAAARLLRTFVRARRPRRAS